MADEQASAPNFLELATDLTVAWLANPNTKVTADELPGVISKMYGALTGLADPVAEVEAAPEYTPAVTARRSLASKDHIISMIDGKPYKMLRRHLSTNGLTPEEYRARYNLKADYPMVAESYATKRRELAKSIGLGRGGRVPAKTAAKPAAKPAKRGRPKGPAKTASAPAAE